MRFFAFISMAVLMLLGPLSGAGMGEGLFDKQSFELGTMQEGEPAEFVIELKNTSDAPLSIEEVDTSCGCTIANAPKGPIKPGETARVSVSIDTSGKVGAMAKTLTIKTDQPGQPHVLTLKGRVEHFGEGLPDVSVVFRGDCRSCHVGADVEKKFGKALYNSVCFLCHQKGLSPEAASSGGLIDVIERGIPGTSMPGFLTESGGPLNPAQTESLAEHVRERFGNDRE